VGPLITALVLYLRGGYKHAFAVLLISALLCLGSLIFAHLLHLRTQEFEKRPGHLLKTHRFPKAYWIYFTAGLLIAAGFADFSLISYHFQKAATVSQNLIPVFYSAAMAAGAAASLLFGRLLDRYGRLAALPAFLLSALSAPLVFLGGFEFALAGVMLWGLGMGAQDALLKALLAGTIAPENRSTGFGFFDTGFGIAWFAGSTVMGLLYGVSIPALVAFSIALQLSALPFFAFAKID
jgi:predicted MFS family arabinose efflux permease